jgi:arylsulfatase A-like enzyme
MNTLDEEGLTSQTIVIFTSDNGGERYSDNGGLSKGKASLWEGGIKVPAFVRWPGQIRAGVSSPQPIITMDWSATILKAAGAQAHPDFPLDGLDLMPICTGQLQTAERTFYWRTFQRGKQKATQTAVFQRLKKKYAEWEKTVLKPIPL